MKLTTEIVGINTGYNEYKGERENKKLEEKIKNMSIVELKNYIEINLDTMKESDLSVDTKSHLKKVVEKSKTILELKKFK